jgi:hypothetical protein
MQLDRLTKDDRAREIECELHFFFTLADGIHATRLHTGGLDVAELSDLLMRVRLLILDINRIVEEHFTQATVASECMSGIRQLLKEISCPYGELPDTLKMIYTLCRTPVVFENAKFKLYLERLASEISGDLYVERITSQLRYINAILRRLQYERKKSVYLLCRVIIESVIQFSKISCDGSLSVGYLKDRESILNELACSLKKFTHRGVCSKLNGMGAIYGVHRCILSSECVCDTSRAIEDIQFFLGELSDMTTTHNNIEPLTYAQKRKLISIINLSTM